MKTCDTCIYKMRSGCIVLKHMIKDKSCFAWADRDEALRRENDIEMYSFGYGMQPLAYTRKFKVFVESLKNGVADKKWERLSKCEVKEILDKNFIKLYEAGYTDLKISDVLNICESSVRRHRTTLQLPTVLSLKKEPNSRSCTG